MKKIRTVAAGALLGAGVYAALFQVPVNGPVATADAACIADAAGNFWLTQLWHPAGSRQTWTRSTPTKATDPATVSTPTIPPLEQDTETMATWNVYNDENDTIGTVVANDEYSAQDAAQRLTRNAIGVWIERTEGN